MPAELSLFLTMDQRSLTAEKPSILIRSQVALFLASYGHWDTLQHHITLDPVNGYGDVL